MHAGVRGARGVEVGGVRPDGAPRGSRASTSLPLPNRDRLHMATKHDMGSCSLGQSVRSRGANGPVVAIGTRAPSPEQGRGGIRGPGWTGTGAVGSGRHGAQYCAHRPHRRGDSPRADPWHASTGGIRPGAALLWAGPRSESAGSGGRAGTAVDDGCVSDRPQRGPHAAIRRVADGPSGGNDGARSAALARVARGGGCHARGGGVQRESQGRLADQTRYGDVVGSCARRGPVPHSARAAPQRSFGDGNRSGRRIRNPGGRRGRATRVGGAKHVPDGERVLRARTDTVLRPDGTRAADRDHDPQAVVRRAEGVSSDTRRGPRGARYAATAGGGS